MGGGGGGGGALKFLDYQRGSPKKLKRRGCKNFNLLILK